MTVSSTSYISALRGHSPKIAADAFKGLTLAELKAVKKGNVDKSAYSIALLAAIRAECGEGAEGTQAFVVKWDATLHSARQKIGETRNAAANAQNVKPSNFTLITKTYTHADEAKPVTEAVARLAAAPNTPVTATAPSASSDDGERDEDKDADGADEEVEIDILSEAGDVPMPPSRRPESSVVGEASLGSSEAVNERAAVEPQSPSGGYAFKTYNATGNGYGPLPAVAETAQAVSTTDPLSAPTFTAINALPSPQDRTVAAGTTPPRSGDLARATKKQKTSHDPSHESHRPKTLLYGKPEQRRAFFALEAIRELLDPSRPVVLTSPEILFTTFHPVQWKFEGLAETPASSANFRTFCASAYAARLFRSCNGGKGIDEYVRWVIKEYMISGCTTGASFLKFLTFRMAHAGGFRVCEAVARKVYERQVEIELEIELEMERELEEEFVEEFGEDPEEESGEEFGA